MQGIMGGLAAVLGMMLQLYSYVVLAAVIVSLVNADPHNFVVAFIRRLTEPLFSLIRRRLPFVLLGGLDLSPLVVYAILVFLQHALVGNLQRMAY
jgi:YggT family protein